MSTSLECYNQKSGVQSGEIILPFYHRSNTVFFFAVALTFTLVAWLPRQTVWTYQVYLKKREIDMHDLCYLSQEISNSWYSYGRLLISISNVVLFGFGNNLKPHPQTDPVVSCYFGTVHEWLYVVSTSDDFVKVGHFWKLAFLTYFQEDTQF